MDELAPGLEANLLPSPYASLDVECVQLMHEPVEVVPSHTQIDLEGFALDQNEIDSLRVELQNAKFIIHNFEESRQLDRDRAQVEQDLLRRQAEALANQLARARAATNAEAATTVEATKRRRAPSVPSALEWSVDYDAFQRDEFVANSLRTRAEEAEARERVLRSDVTFLKRRLRDSMAQLKRVESELRKSRASLLVTPIIEHHTEIVLPSGDRLFKSPDEPTQRYSAKLNRSATLGDAEAEHLVIAARKLGPHGKIRRVHKVLLDKAIRRQAREIMRLPSEDLEDADDVRPRFRSTRHAPTPTKRIASDDDEDVAEVDGRAYFHCEPLPERESVGRAAKRRRVSYTAPDTDEDEAELEATDVEDPEPEVQVVNPPKRVPSALDVLAEASSAASQSQGSSENLLPHLSSGSSSATTAPAELLAAFAPPPPTGGVFSRQNRAASVGSTPAPPPVAIAVSKVENNPQQSRRRRFSSASASSPAAPAHVATAPALAPSPAPARPVSSASPLPIKAPAWVNGKPRKPRASIAGAKKERAAYIKWNDAEDEVLIQAVLKNGLRWESVASDVPSRSYHQVRQRFLRGLKSGWTLPAALEHYAEQVKKVVEDHEKKRPKSKAPSSRRPRGGRRNDDDDDDDEDDEDDDEEDEDEYSDGMSA